MSKKQKILVKILILVDVVLLIGAAWFFVRPYFFTTEFALLNPAGEIANKEFNLLKKVLLIMSVVAVPMFMFVLYILFRKRPEKISLFEPIRTPSRFWQVVIWLIPITLIFIISIINWKTTHELDPYKPLVSEKKPLVIQVVALNWKWLFIYPEQRIATVNFIQIPKSVPVEFNLTADAPMNSFWIPQLSGQMYSMAGMTTKLNLMADSLGEYEGFAAEINGKGFADMNFTARVSSAADFENWVKNVKTENTKLDFKEYQALAKPSEKHKVQTFSYVEPNIYEKIMEIFMPQSLHSEEGMKEHVESLNIKHPSFSY